MLKHDISKVEASLDFHGLFPKMHLIGMPQSRGYQCNEVVFLSVGALVSLSGGPIWRAPIISIHTKYLKLMLKLIRHLVNTEVNSKSVLTMPWHVKGFKQLTDRAFEANYKTALFTSNYFQDHVLEDRGQACKPLNFGGIVIPVA